MLRRWSCSRWYRPRCCSPRPVLSSLLILAVGLSSQLPLPLALSFWFFASQAASIADLYASSSSLLSAPQCWRPGSLRLPILRHSSFAAYHHAPPLIASFAGFCKRFPPVELYVSRACVDVSSSCLKLLDLLLDFAFYLGACACINLRRTLPRCTI